jgi:hypothetical protein
MSKRVVGNLALLRELFVKVAQGTQSVAAHSSVEIFLEDLNELRHTHYTVSVFCEDSVAIIDAYQHGTGEVGGGGGGNASGLHGTILKRRRVGAGATQFLDVRLLLGNNSSTTRTINYQVWRIAGLAK